MTTRHIEAGRATYITGDVRDALAATPDASVDLVLTSPPFLALRSYLPADHPDKHREIGSEPDPATFLDTLLALTAEWRRVLAPHGSICVELGDTYAGSGGAGGDYNSGGLRDGQAKFSGSAAKRAANGVGNDYRPARSGRDAAAWPLPKSLCGIPHLYHLSLAYGRNLLTGEPSPAGQWRVRNVVAWCRPNPPVGALGDKFRPATSYMTIACPSGSRYFDLDAVRTPGENAATRRVGAKSDASHLTPRERGDVRPGEHPAGAPPLDWWEIPTQPYSGAHYAAFPPALVERPIKSMTPRRVCRTCGQPSRRIVESTEEYAAARAALRAGDPASASDYGRNVGNSAESFGTGGGAASLISNGKVSSAPVTLGWTDCECSDDGSHWRPGIVLDPFAGSGTTLMVATGLGHAALGFDLDPRNVDLARDRVGPMFLDEHTLADLTTETAS